MNVIALDGTSKPRSFVACTIVAALLQACAATPSAGVEVQRVAVAKPAVVDPMEVPLDTRGRPTVPLRMEVVDANDATRGAQLAMQLEPFRKCLDEYRQSRGYAGGRIGIIGHILADGSLDHAASPSDFGDSFERCIAADVRALRWPKSDLEAVGFVASVLVHDSSRRAPSEVRPRRPNVGASSRLLAEPTPLAPFISWSLMQTDSPEIAALKDDLTRRSGILSDCLWHAWPTSEPSAEASLQMRVDPSGTLSGTLRGEGEAPAPELQECLGRMLSVVEAPKTAKGGVLSAHLLVGVGGVGLRGR